MDSCSLATGCVYQPAPAVNCRAADASFLLLRNEEDDGKDALAWKWTKGEATLVGELANPTVATGYTLCVYAGSANAVVGHIEIPPGSRWSAAGEGFKYKDGSGTSDGIIKALVKGGTTGKSRALAKAKGAALDDPVVGNLPLPVRAQLVNKDTNVCLESLFGGTDVIVNDDTAFKAKVK
jgi:hypothetical protein